MDEEQNERGASGQTATTRRPYFGRRLRELRESYAQRVSRSDDEIPPLRMNLSAAELIQCMARHRDVKISQAAYNEIEQGFNTPRDAGRFLDAVATCLRLTPDDRNDLERRLAYDILWARLRERTDDVFPRGGDWPAPEQ